jgi:hypothetical protein
VPCKHSRRSGTPSWFGGWMVWWLEWSFGRVCLGVCPLAWATLLIVAAVLLAFQSDHGVVC